MLKQMWNNLPTKFDIAIDDYELVDVVEEAESVPAFLPVLIVVVAVLIVVAILLVRRAKKH